MFCGNCGRPIADNSVQCSYCGKEFQIYYQNMDYITDGTRYKNKCSTRVIMTAIFIILFYGIEILLLESGLLLMGLPVYVVFGWKSLTRIQPRMFIWMPIAHWLVYFGVKFFLALLIGIFVTPFVFGNIFGKIFTGT